MAGAAMPNVIGLGFPKAGTTFIVDVLRDHPEVCFSTRKETHFFTTRYDRGLDWYLSNFSHYNTERHKVIAEWSNDYNRSKDALKRIREVLGRPKILLSYRDPVSAFESDVKYMMTIGQESPRSTPRELFDNKKERYLERYYYDRYIEDIYQVFGKEDVLIMRYEDMKRDMTGFFSRLFSFIGVSDIDLYSGRRPVNASQPYRFRKYQSLLAYILIKRYGDARHLNYHPDRKPAWLRALQGLNAKRVELDPQLKEELKALFSPHMEAFKSKIS